MIDSFINNKSDENVTSEGKVSMEQKLGKLINHI